MYIPILSFPTYHYDSSSERQHVRLFVPLSHPRMTHLKVLTRLEYRSSVYSSVRFLLTLVSIDSRGYCPSISYLRNFVRLLNQHRSIPREITSKSPIVLQEFKKKGIGIIIGRIWSTRRGIKILGLAKGRAFKKRAALRCFIRLDKEATWRNKHTATLITREQSVLTR